MFEEIKRPFPPSEPLEQEEYQRCQAESWIFHLCEEENRLPQRGEVEKVMRCIEEGSLSWGLGLYDNTRTVCFNGNPTLKARADKRSQARVSFLGSDWRDFFYLLRLQWQFQIRHRTLFLPWKEIWSPLLWSCRVPFRWKSPLKPCCFNSLRDYLKEVPDSRECVCLTCLEELQLCGKTWHTLSEPQLKKLKLPPFTDWEIRCLLDAQKQLLNKARHRAIDQLFKRGKDWEQVRTILHLEICYSGHRFDVFGRYLGRVTAPAPSACTDTSTKS